MTRSYLKIIILCVVGLLGLLIVRVTQTPPSNVFFNLTSEQLEDLKKQAIMEKKSDAAWRVFDYYEVTKHDHIEAKKWMDLATQLESENKSKNVP